MKSIGVVNKVVSQKLNIPLNVVTLVNEFYWKTSKEKLINYEATTLFYKHLGSITISKYKVYKEIHRVIERIRTVRNHPQYGEEAKKRYINDNMLKLKKLLVHRNNLAQEEYDRRIFSLNNKKSSEDSSDFESDFDED